MRRVLATVFGPGGGGSFAPSRRTRIRVITWASMEIGLPTKSAPSFAVVLSGGATLGAFEAGVIDSLASSGVRPGLLVGTSIGALNAAYWAFNPGPGAGAALAAAWRTAPGAGIFPRWPTSVVVRLAEDDPVGDPSHLRRFLSSIFGEGRSIEAAPIPLALVCVDLVEGEPVVLRTGDLIQALLASTAIPGLYPPVEIAGRLLADGGVVANADLEEVVASHIEDAVMVDLMWPATREQLKGTRDMVEQAITIALARQTELERRLISGQLRLAIIRLRLPYRPHGWDFRFNEQLFAMGREAAGKFMASHLVDGQVVPSVIEPELAADQPAQVARA